MPTFTLRYQGTKPPVKTFLSLWRAYPESTLGYQKHALKGTLDQPLDPIFLRRVKLFSRLYPKSPWILKTQTNPYDPKDETTPYQIIYQNGCLLESTPLTVKAHGFGHKPKSPINTLDIRPVTLVN